HASYAPTHYMKEPWNIKVFEREGKAPFIKKIMDSYKRTGMFDTVTEEKLDPMVQSMSEFLLKIPHHALIYLPIEEDPVRYEEEYAAVSAFIQNAQLAAWNFDVGMLWTITPYMHDPEFAKDLGLKPDREKIAAVLQIGYPASIPKKRSRTPIQEKLRFIRE